jgi:FkbM family methyltransferase
MTFSLLRKVLSLIGSSYIFYHHHTPNHKGKQRLAIILDSLFGPFILKTGNGLLMELFLSSPMDMSYCRLEANLTESQSQIIEYINNLNKGDIFIDVGANIGYYSLLAANQVDISGKVFSFEPSPREFQRLLSSLSLNRTKNIIPFNLALSSKKELLQLTVADHHTGLNYLGNEDNESSVLISALPGDMLLDMATTSGKVLVKIDVEGGEFSVLSGMRSFLKQEIVKTVIVEITPKFLEGFGHTKAMIYELMADCGYTPIIKTDSWQYDEVFIH